MQMAKVPIGQRVLEAAIGNQKTASATQRLPQKKEDWQIECAGQIKTSKIK